MAEHVRRSRELAMTAGLAMALIVGTASCGNDNSDDLPPPASPDGESPATTPATTLDPRDAEAWEEIQTKFDGLMETWIKWGAEGLPGGFVDEASLELNEYADEFLLRDVVAELGRERDEGHLRSGQASWRDSRLLKVDWERTVQDRVIPEAVFDVCVDDSDWLVVDADTGEPVSVTPAGPQVWTVTAWFVEKREFGPDGWALAQRSVDGSQSC